MGTATGVLSACDDGCPDELAGHTCPPQCPTCSCAAHPGPMSVAKSIATVDVITIAHSVSFEYAATFAPSPDPQELLHVPRQPG